MQRYQSPGEVAVPPEENLTRSLWEAASTDPDRPAVAHRVGDAFVEWSWRRFVDEIAAVAKGLIGMGVQLAPAELSDMSVSMKEIAANAIAAAV